MFAPIPSQTSRNSTIKRHGVEDIMHILLVDDDHTFSTTLAKVLRRSSYTVDVAGSGQEVADLVGLTAYDLIILDRLMPDIDGMILCQQLRHQGLQTPILMLTGKAEPRDFVDGLDAGADDYLAKPFAIAELEARIRSLLRRKVAQQCPLRLGGLSLDPATREVVRDGCPISLTRREFDLLAYLMRHAGRVVTRTDLTEHVWEDYGSPDSNVTTVYVAQLRRKIDPEPASSLIQTVRGIGYTMSPDGDGAKGV